MGGEDSYLGLEVLILCSQAHAAEIGKEAERSPDPAKVYSKKKKMAMGPAKEALKYAKKLQSKRCVSHGLLAVAEAGMVVGDFNAALKSAAKAETAYKDAKDEAGEAATYLIRGEVHFASKENKKAEDFASKAEALAASGKERMLEARAQDLIYRIHGGGQAAAQQGFMQDMMMGMGGDVGAQSLEAAPQKQGLDPKFVEGIVMKTAKDSTGLDDELHLDSPLMESGMDSLSSVSFRNQLMREVGMNLPAALMFDYPCVRAIVDNVVEMSKA